MPVTRPPAAFAEVRHNVPLDEAGTTMSVDAGAMAANWRLLRAQADGAECAAVVKANAYGLGLEATVAALRAAGCRTYFVAHVFEGRQVRALAPESVIYVLNGLLPNMARLFLDFDLRPVLGSLPEIEDWIAAAPRGAACALQLDSGMNRLGLISGQVAEAARLSARLDVALVSSHFVWSDHAQHREKAMRQIADFEAARRLWPGVPASMANSSGIFYGAEAHFDLVRPGYAIYGGNPTPDRPNPMRSVVTFAAHVIQVHEVAAGESVGYDAQWIAPTARRLATISVGYADGIPCGAVGSTVETRGVASIGGALCPIVGRISMDLIVIDVTEVPNVARGDSVELIGADISIDDLAKRAGTIGYDVLTRLGPRSHRRVLGGWGPTETGQ